MRKDRRFRHPSLGGENHVESVCAATGTRRHYLTLDVPLRYDLLLEFLNDSPRRSTVVGIVGGEQHSTTNLAHSPCVAQRPKCRECHADAPLVLGDTGTIETIGGLAKRHEPANGDWRIQVCEEQDVPLVVFVTVEVEHVPGAHARNAAQIEPKLLELASDPLTQGVHPFDVTRGCAHLNHASNGLLDGRSLGAQVRADTR